MPKLLHLYAQPFWHAEAYIVGNRAGLEALRDALSRALGEEESQRNSAATLPAEGCVMGADGEGYQVVVIREDSDWQGKPWTDMASPYTDKEAGAVEYRDNAVWPGALLTEADLRELMGVQP